MKRNSSPASQTAEATSLLEKSRLTAIGWATVIAVFALTFAFRWPFLAESFWIDELHTAWCIADGWNDVVPRAKMGNQQPLYFWGLWIWQQIPWPEPWASYPVEVLPRVTSLVCVSLSAALITWGSIRFHGSLLAAFVAGLAVAIDRQAAFFAVELRPYAAVVLGSTLAIGFAAKLRASGNSSRKRDWFGLHASVLFATLMHVTALITLAPLVAAMTVSDFYRSRQDSNELKHKLWRHTGWLALWVLAGVLIANDQQEIWDRREAWSSFGRPESLFAFWRMWPWLGWAMVPASLSLLCLRFFPARNKLPVRDNLSATTSAKRRQQIGPNAAKLSTIDPTLSFAVLLLGVLLVSVMSAFVLSEFGGVPIWQRRYLIAGLPLGCISLGGWIASLRNRVHYKLLVPLIAIPSLIAIAWSQHSIHPNVASYWVYRGEDWRTALTWIADSTESDGAEANQRIQHHLWIDGDLIEQPAITGWVTDVELATYLTLPARGPYSPGEHTLLHALGSRAPMEGWQEAVQSSDLGTPNSKHWFLSRLLSSNQRSPLSLDEQEIQFHGQFGNLFLYSKPPSAD